MLDENKRLDIEHVKIYDPKIKRLHDINFIIKFKREWNEVCKMFGKDHHNR